MDLKNLNYDKNIVLDTLQILGEYSFRLDGIPDVKIKIKLYKNFDRDDVCFSLSHFIHAPELATVYIPSGTFSYSEETALEKAINSITNYYNAAVEKGYIPGEDWLVENTSY